MKRILLFSLLSCALITGCANQNRRQVDERASSTAYGGRFGYQGEEVVEQEPVQSDAQVLEQTPAPQTPAPSPQVRPTPPPAPVVRRDTVYGVPVPGKPGFVTSPYAPNSGLVDVRGYPPGTEVKDPYTEKVFLVP